MQHVPQNLSVLCRPLHIYQPNLYSFAYFLCMLAFFGFALQQDGRVFTHERGVVTAGL
jgi:hypothetical protein